MKDKKPTDGETYWRSLDQLENTPEYREFLYREFPQGASEMDNSWSRRSFLALMGASAALAGLAGCRRPVEKIVPYVTQPEEVIPGVAAYYATTMPFGLAAYGLLVKSNEGRPTKIEGNPEHPSTLGSSTVLMQAEVLNLYDPDRSSMVIQSGAEKTWDDFVSFWRERLAFFQKNQGEGVAFMSESFHSPTMARLADAIKAAFPRATWVAYEPISYENMYDGVLVATGQDLQPLFHLDKADVILVLDSDFLCNDQDSIRLSRGFADGRRIMTQQDKMNRLYAVESGYTSTGASADHRLRLQSRQIGDFLLALIRELQAEGLSHAALAGITPKPTGTYDQKWLKGLARDLMRTRGSNLIFAGHGQPASVHALALALNEALGNIGRTVTLVDLQDEYRANRGSLKGLVDQMNTGGVDTLVMLGGNPVYDAPVDLNFTAALSRVKHSVHLSLHQDETSVLAEWHLPRSHFLESWGDARALDGTLSIVQPLVEPLYATHSLTELLGLIGSGTLQKGYDLVRQTMQSQLGAVGFEHSWRKLLHDGYLKDSAAKEITASVDGGTVASYLIDHPLPTGVADPNDLELVFSESVVWDGRYANNGWLQELPDPVTRLDWDNVILISPRTAQALGVQSEDLVNLEFQGRELPMPIWVNPGQTDNSIKVQLGYGRTQAGRVGNKVGFNTYQLRTVEAMDFGVGAKITKLGQSYKLATVQDHGSMEGRPILREATLQEFQKTGDLYPEQIEHPPLQALWNEFTYDEGYQWGMAIDLAACTGCNACVIACQAENNVPIVGKEQVSRGREMHWLRMDRYYKGEPDDPAVSFQPMLCQHCQNAPCENVCPVGATMHDREGLNVMVYNRCIGTRYCSNNCPYKVRRFNFYNYTKDLPETVRMQQNPDVTVRFRGVMEKCTYCVQRINAAKLASKKANRLVQDGDVVTACQQACPSRAIVFGNIREETSQVVRLKRAMRNYAVLEDYNTKPRTTYLGKIRNINPEIGESPIAGDTHTRHEG